MSDKKQVFRNRIIIFGGYRISMHTNKVTFSQERELLECSAFEDVGQRYVKGSFSTEMGFEGYLTSSWEEKIYDQLLDEGSTPFLLMGDDKPVTGSRAYFTNAFLYGIDRKAMRYKTVNVSAKVKADAVRFQYGTVLHNAIGTPGLAGGAPDAFSDVLTLPPLPVGKKLSYVVSAVDPPGIPADALNPLLSWELQSDVDGTFVAAHVRASGTLSGPDAVLGEVPGEVTDTRWRLRLSATGTNTLFHVVAAVAVS